MNQLDDLVRPDGMGLLSKKDAQAARLLDMGNTEKTAYEIARNGGRHKGLYRTWQDKPSGEIERSIRSLREQIDVHLDKIANPDKYITEVLSTQQREGLVQRYWPKEIANFRQQIEIFEGILKERER